MESRYRNAASLDEKEEAPRVASTGYPGKRTLTARLLIARRARDGSGVVDDDATRAAIEEAQGASGSVLDEPMRLRFEASLGVSLSHVRIHTGGEAARAAEALSARAFTLGGDIYFADGQYDATSDEGQRLLAHEVAHTVQQSSAGAIGSGGLEVSAPGDALEVEADHAADAMLGGAPSAVSPASGVARQVIQRAPGDPDPAPAAPAPAQGDPAAQPAAQPAGSGQLTITTATVKTAPSGAATRFVVGVGEEVKLTGSETGAWTASGGTPTTGDGTEFTWKAPNTPATITVKLKAGDKEATKSFSVIAPTSIKFTNAGDMSYPAGKQGAGMSLNMHIGADNVSFGNVRVKEIPSGAHSVSGFFGGGKRDLSHKPNVNWTSVADNNDLNAQDQAFFDGFDPPWVPGAMSWSVVHNWSVDGAGDGTPFTIVTQTMKIADNKGTSIVTKGTAATAPRTP